MKGNFARLATLVFLTASGAAHADDQVTMNLIDAKGVGKQIGTLSLSDTNAGLQVTPQLTELPPGERGFHVHV